MSDIGLAAVRNKVIDDLLASSILNSREVVKSIDFFPPVRADIALRLSPHTPIKLPDSGFPIDSDVVQSASKEGIFLNVGLDFNYVYNAVIPSTLTQRNSYGSKPHTHFQSLVVEHTSLNPIMPINLATFRTSVVGDAIANLYRLNGTDVSTHFWVEYVPKKFEPIYSALVGMNIDASEIKKFGKPDHVLGAMFTAVLCIHDRQKFAAIISENARKTMFPLSESVFGSGEYPMVSISDGDLHFLETIDALKDMCISGFDQTFHLCDIKIDYYDVDPEYRQFDLGEKDVNRLSFAERNLLYHQRLHRTHHPSLVVSVVSRALQEVVKRTEKLISERSASKTDSCFLQVGELVVTNCPDSHMAVHGLGEKLDKIKTASFHSVDEYIDYNSSLMRNRSKREIANCLKFELLRVAAQTRCQIEFILNPRSDYFYVLDTLRASELILAESQQREVRLEVSRRMFSTCERQLIKRIGIFPDVTSSIIEASRTNNASFPIHQLVSYIMIACSDANNYFSELKNVPIDHVAQSVVEAFLISIRNALAMIGISSN